MTTAHLLAIAWSPDPSVIGGCAALLVAYGAWLRRALTPRAITFATGVVVLVITLISPIDRLGELYLFSVHMVQHMLLILVVPPLLLWGLPVAATRGLLRVPVIDRLERTIGRPKVTLPLKILALYAWHVPALYDLALRNEQVHALEHLIFLVTATMFWWPVLTPLRERRIKPQAAMMYLIGAMAAIALLGMAITLAPTVLYPFYSHPPDPYGALHLVRQGWGISALADQQIGGLLMWIGGGIFYIVAILTEFGLWFQEPEEDEVGGPTLGRREPSVAAVVASVDTHSDAPAGILRRGSETRRTKAGAGSRPGPAPMDDTMEGAR